MRDRVIVQKNSEGNLLIEGASVLLSLAREIKKGYSDYSAPVLKALLLAELKSFEERTRIFGYQSQSIAQAKYLLAALLDEIISLGRMGVEMAWEKGTLLRASGFYDVDEAYFAQILKNNWRGEKDNCDLLELIYLILSLGYQGAYRGQKNGRFLLEQISNNIYQQLLAHKSEAGEGLLIGNSLANARNKKSPFFTKVIIAFSVTFFLIFGSVLILEWRLSAEAKPLAQVIQDLGTGSGMSK
jgi:type VI secretion system protein ImpK